MEIKETYSTMGRYDLVCVIDAPDDETYAKGCSASVRREISVLRR